MKSPHTIIIASGFWISEPMPEERAAGNQKLGHYFDDTFLYQMEDVQVDVLYGIAVDQRWTLAVRCNTFVSIYLKV